MKENIPTVENDRIVMYACVSGKDKSGVLRTLESAYDIPPTLIGNKVLRAIQSTTAAALCESAYYLLTNNSKGVILQTDLDPEEFVSGPYVTVVYG